MTAYQIYVTPAAWAEMRSLPGHMKQRVKQAVDGLANNPQPRQSKQLAIIRKTNRTTSLYRLRIDQWRIIYAINGESELIQVLAIRKRPPYDYQDLEDLLKVMLL